jgi:hypothetical protein
MSKQTDIIDIVDEADSAYQTIRHLINIMRAREELPEAEVAFGFVEHIDASPILMKMALLLDQTQAATYQLFNLLKNGIEIHLVHDPVFAVWDDLQRKKGEQNAAPEAEEIRNPLFEQFHAIQGRLFSTPARTPGGVKLQIRQLFDFMDLRDLWPDAEAYLKGLEASLDNLQPKHIG